MSLLNSITVLTGAVLSSAQEASETAACGEPDKASSVCLGVLRTTGNSVLAQASNTFLVRPARMAVVLVLAFLVQRLVRRAIKRFVRSLQTERVNLRLESIRDRAPRALVDTGAVPSLRRSQRAETIGALLRSVSSLTIWTLAAVMAMGELGLNLGPLIAGAGIVGVAIGFGAQNLVRDFVSGIFMLVEDQYGVGDVIDAGAATGEVEAVSLRTTRLRDVHGTVWHIPNGQINRIGNRSQQWSRAVLDIHVDYTTDIAEATSVILRSALETWQDPRFDGLIVEQPEVWGVENLGGDGIAIRLVAKTAPNQHAPVARALREGIKVALDRAGIEAPSPAVPAGGSQVRGGDGNRRGAALG